MDENDDLPCKPKLAFDTFEQAEAAAVTVKYQHGTSVKPYICKFCNLWHLASDYS
jgi:hypothetical protein